MPNKLNWYNKHIFSEHVSRAKVMFLSFVGNDLTTLSLSYVFHSGYTAMILCLLFKVTQNRCIVYPGSIRQVGLTRVRLVPRLSFVFGEETSYVA